MANNFGTGSITGKFKNPYQFSSGRVNSDTSEALFQAMKRRNSMQFELDEERSLLDRTFDALQVGNYTTANYASDWVKTIKGVEGSSFLNALNPFDDIASGLRAANPFGAGSREDEKHYSTVIEEMGWKPTSGIGRFTKGTLGFAGDVLLDPLTYLSGGLSAVVKGTGHVGKAAKTLSALSDTHNGGVALTHMTEEVAGKIIKESEVFKKLNPSPEQFAADAKQFATNFNKQLGIRTVNPKPITIGIANLPFGDKLAPKLGVLGKTLHLSDGANVRKLADTIGTARAYAGIRNSIYGSQIGKKLSTNTPLWRAAQEDPAKLYELMAHVNMVKGMNLSKLDAEKMIRQKSDELGSLTKADSKEVMELLQDNTIWAQVKGVLKFAETNQAKDLKRSLHGERASVLSEMDGMKALRSLSNEVEAVKAAGTGTKVLDSLDAQFREALKKMDLEAVSKNTDQRAELHAMLETRINDATKAIEKVDGSVLKGAKGEDAVRQLSKIANAVVAESDAAAISQKLATAANKSESIVHVKEGSGKGKVVKTGANRDKIQNDTISLVERSKLYESLSEVAYGHGTAFNLGSHERLISDTVPILKDMLKFKGADEMVDVDKFIFANRGFFGKPTAKQMGQFTEMLHRGDFEGMFQDYLSRNAHVADDHAKDVHKYMASKLGYGNFNKDVIEPLEKLRKKNDIEPQNMTTKEVVRYEELLNKAHQRQEGIRKYYKEMDHKTFKEFNRADAYTKSVDDYEDMMAKDSGRYDTPDVEDVLALAKEGGEGVVRQDKVLKPLKREELLTGKSRETIRGRVEASLVESAKRSDANFTNDLAKNITKLQWRVDKVTDDVATVMMEKHTGKYMHDLNGEDEIRDLIKETLRYGARIAGKEGKFRPLTPSDVQKGLKNDEVSSGIIRKAEVMKSISNELQRGRTVKVAKDGQEFQGAITAVRKDADDTMLYTLRQGEDTVDFRIGEVTDIPTNVKLKTIRQVIDEDEAVQALVKLRTSTQKELDELSTADPNKLTFDQNVARSQAIRDQAAKVTAVKGNIARMEQQARKARELIDETFGDTAESMLSKIQSGAKADDIYKVFDGRVERLSKQVADIDDVLKTDEAFEDYMKVAYGDDFARATADAANHNEGLRHALDERASSEQVANHVRALRETFNKAGGIEVTWGKLGKEQFNAMMEHYLPHVPTQDGARYFASMKEIKEHSPMITDGYGYGMKWNPFAKSRTIEGKTIDEINEQFMSVMKGKNIFSDNLSDIYLARMMKHEELRYDQEYMHNMMNMFGKDIGDDGVQEGYKAVANYGMLRKHFGNEAKAAMSVRMREARRGGKRGEYTKDERMAMFEEEIAKVIDSYGFKPGVLDKHGTPMVELTKEQVTKLNTLDKGQIEALGADSLAKQVSDGIVQKANQSRKLAIAKDENRALQMYDKFLHFMKLNQTSVMPSFHIRNKFSNMFQNWLGVGRDAFDPKFQVTAHKAVAWINDVDKLRSLKPIVSDDGKHVYQWDEIVNQAKAHKAIDEGFFAQDIGAGAVSTGLFKNKIKPSWNPTDTGNFGLYKAGTKVGSNIENADRLVHFASMLKQGKTAQEAAESSTKYLFDYSDLTAFEQSVMKRIFPYYTWMRKNMRLQSSELIEQPNKYALIPKIEQWVEGMNNEEELVEQRYTTDFARDWVQTPFGINNDKGEKEPLLMNPNLPFMDIAGMVDPFNIKDSAREFFSQTAPMLKVPVEQALNKNMFFDPPIVREGQSQLGKRAQHVAGQFAMFNAANGATKGDDANNALHLMGSLTGLKLTAYNYERSKSEMLAQGYNSPDPIGTIVETVQKYAGGALSFVGDVVGEGIVNVYGAPPKRADSYDGAMMPISKTSYDKLSKEEKLKYTAPTETEANALNRRAVELADQAYKESGVMKRFAWTILDGLNPQEAKTMGYVTKVADGDTFTVRIGDEEKNVRLLLVDTPETVDPRLDGPQPFGQEASDYTKSVLFGKDVRMVIDGEAGYGRLGAFVEVDGNDFNKQLIEEGLGKVRYLYGRDDEKVDEYFNAEQEAAKRKKGIWSKSGYSTPGIDTGFSNR